MNLKFYAICAISLCANSFFGACSSDSDSSPTRAELCANGLSNECLVDGLWSLPYLVDKSTGEPLAAYTYSTPGTLEFKITDRFKENKGNPLEQNCLDGLPEHQHACPEFVFNYPNATMPPILGTWEIIGNTISLKAFVNEENLFRKKAVVTPIIASDGITIKMTLGELWFTENDFDEVSKRSLYTEVYTISAN